MNNIKVKVHEILPSEEVSLKEVAEKYDGADDFVNNIIDEICSQEKLAAEEIIYFLVGFLQFTFPF